MAKSTKIIAALGVAAGLGVAAMPLATFATDYKTVTDTIEVTVDPSCEFSAGGANTTAQPAASVVRGAVIDFGANKTHSFTVNCNVSTYKVTAIATDLEYQGTKPAEHHTITFNDTDYSESAGDIGDDGQWTAVLSGGDASAKISKTISTIKSGNSTLTDSFSVTYKGYVGKAQSAGTYQGTVTYTLTAPNA